MALKRIRGAVGDAFPQVRWAMDRERGTLKGGWTNLIKIEAQPGDEPFEVAYNGSGLQQLHIDRAALESCGGGRCAA
eukprot:4802917-Pyramimonas_sp.AAC.1